MEQITELKIKSPKELRKSLAELQKEGKKVVFTNGCFDLVHRGHTRYLRAAREAGDILVMGVNSDASISRIKGPKRPIVPLEERMEILAGFYFVDFVTSFDEDTPYNLIQELQPDILIKGGDWPIDQIVGKDIVEARGGMVFTIPEIPGGSTTGIIERVLERH